MKMKRSDPFFGRGFSKNGAFKGRCIFFTLENVLNIYGFISVVCDVVGLYAKTLESNMHSRTRTPRFR